MRRPSRLAAAALLTLGACFPFDGGGHALDGPYYLRATDVAEQMALYYRLDGGDGVARVPATVYAAGWDARHVLVKRHPGGDRAVTEFFIVERAKDGPLREPAASVTGPLDAAAFAGARRQLGVDPALGFSLVLRDLE